MSLNRSDENRLDLEAGALEITAAKYGSTGVVPLDVMTLRVLRHYAREIRPRVRNAATLDRVFLSKTGKPYTPNTLTQKFRLMLARLGFPGRTAHDVRHFYCTDLLRRGVQPHVVQSLARHKDARTTLGIYAHASFEDLRSAVNRRVG